MNWIAEVARASPAAADLLALWEEFMPKERGLGIEIECGHCDVPIGWQRMAVRPMGWFVCRVRELYGIRDDDGVMTYKTGPVIAEAGGPSQESAVQAAARQVRHDVLRGAL